MPSKNKNVIEKPAKVLSQKKQNELDHLQGKHDVMQGAVPDCGLCSRRLVRLETKQNKTKVYLKTHPSK